MQVSGPSLAWNKPLFAGNPEGRSLEKPGLRNLESSLRGWADSLGGCKVEAGNIPGFDQLDTVYVTINKPDAYEPVRTFLDGRSERFKPNPDLLQRFKRQGQDLVDAVYRHASTNLNVVLGFVDSATKNAGLAAHQ